MKNQELPILPSGYRTLEDYVLIDYLLKDQVFIESIESSMGTIKKLYADWKRNLLIYELVDGRSKCSELHLIVKKLKELNYIQEFLN